MKAVRFLCLLTLCLPLSLLAQLPEGFVQELLADGLDPTGLSIAPDGRVFVVEKKGRILVVENDQLLETPFLDIEVDNENERGLQSMVFHPDFELNNYFYVFYTIPGQGRNRISRFTANGNATLGGSEEILFELNPLFGTVHNGGGMRISKDGYLMISVGDGSNPNKASDLDYLGGKFLRLNLDGSIPEDNPFYQELEGPFRAIYAYGFRNTFGWSLDPVSGMILANDVGNTEWEEVNRVEAGMGYGWPNEEGPASGLDLPENYRDPVHAYDHNAGCAVTLSTFYYGPEGSFPEQYQGKYFFGDYCRGWIKVMDPESGEIEETFTTGLDRPIAAIAGTDGALYLLLRPGLGGGGVDDNTSTGSGELWRIRFVGDGKPFIGRQPKSVLVPVGEDAEFSLQASGDQPLSYQWWMGDSLLVENTEASITIEKVSLELSNAKVYCKLTNALGSITSDTAILQVTPNQRPDLQINEPAVSSSYRAGDVLYFSGEGTDQEDGNIEPSDLSWRIDFHHDDHAHPAMSITPGITEGYYQIPTIGEIDTNVWYRVSLFATDKEGLTGLSYRDVYPELTSYTLHTEPEGIEIVTDIKKAAAPIDIYSVVGITRSAQAVPFHFRGDTIFYFTGWGGNAMDGEKVLTFSAGAFDTDTAFYAYVVPEFGDGEGLKAEYYNHQWQGAPFEQLIVEQIDTSIEFDWQTGSPFPGQVNPDNFSIRWTGSIQATVSGTHFFHGLSDGNYRLWINDQEVIDRWEIGENASAEAIGSIEMEAGKLYPFILEYQHNWWLAKMNIQWSSPLFPKSSIPVTQLYPDDVSPIPGSPLGFILSVELFPNPSTLGRPISARLFSPEPQSIRWEIVALNGSKITGGQEALLEGENVMQIPANQLPPGFYILSVKSLLNGREIHLRLVRQ